jgi:hypothetical protein
MYKIKTYILSIGLGVEIIRLTLDTNKSKDVNT